MKALALKYRPKSFKDVTEQGVVTEVLTSQVDNNEVKQGYIFVGAAGTGKTTCARIFANMINKGEGMPIEMDAASNNSVDNVREIAKMAQVRSIDSEYKVFILDEVHMFSAGAWAAMLKLIEEPPAKTIFILCTTDYWKIPKTILSRCQRYDFKRISLDGIESRLRYIFDKEFADSYTCTDEAFQYLARVSDGCMREAVTNLDKITSLYLDIGVDEVSAVLGITSFTTYMDLTDSIMSKDTKNIISIIESVYASGEDLKQFVKGYVDFILDVVKYSLMGHLTYTKLPDNQSTMDWLSSIDIENSRERLNKILDVLVYLDSDIKFSQNPKAVIEARLMSL